MTFEILRSDNFLNYRSDMKTHIHGYRGRKHLKDLNTDKSIAYVYFRTPIKTFLKKHIKQSKSAFILSPAPSPHSRG